ncbi:DUF7507 domain-containing protein [Methanothrix harundinacea]|uniref:DUF7507 domain-containing protein n=1 Tax=Methanothrix harundinacea TaxID=301375 RepID=UPI00064E9A6C|nr:lamin tail domain-containing protein [Methanothrix harundinacea]
MIRKGPGRASTLLILALISFASITGAFAALSGSVIAPASVNICESTGFVVYINNTGTTPENDILLNVTIPSGFSYDDGTTVITFPNGSSNQDPQIKGGGAYLEWNLTDIMSTETGVVLNEIFPNPIGVETSNESFELYNAGASLVNVSQWYIKDAADHTVQIGPNVISGSLNLPPGGFLWVRIPGQSILNTGGDTVRLFDGSNVLVDSVTYPDSASHEGQSWASMPDGSECWSWRSSSLGATNGDLAAGERIRLDFNLTAGCATPSGGRIRDEVIYQGGSVTRSSNSILVKQGFLKVAKTPTVVEAGAGDVVNWTITVENTGLGPAFNVRMNDTLSSGLNLLSIDSPGGGLNWSYDVIPPGGVEVVNISVNVTACEDLFNRVNASWGCDGSPCQETYAKASVKFVPRDPDLEYTVSPMVVPYCGRVPVYVNVTNEGAGGITELQLRFAGISADYAVTNVSGATFYPANETFFIGRVPAGEWKNFTFDFGMAYGACGAAGASGTITIYPFHCDDCANPWYPPVSLESYSMDGSTIPSISVSKTANRSVIYLGEEVEFDLEVTYTAGSCGENTTRTIVDSYPSNFLVIDSAGGVNDSGNRTITWADQLLEDGVTWNKTIRLSADRDAAACDCGGQVTNALSVSQGEDCCGCNISGSSSADVVVVCINETVLASSNKTATPVPQENCRNVTYTTTYTFADSIGSLNWTGINFTELGGNGQLFPDGNTSGTATFTVNDSCSVDQTITIESPKNLGFLNGACGPLGGGTVLVVTYTLGQPDIWSGYDWSRLCIEGYGTECGGDGCLYEAAPVTVSQADYSIGISGVPTRLDVCQEFNVTISVSKGSPNEDPKWIGHDMYVVYNDENYRYIGNATISGITNYVSPSQSDLVGSFEPTRVGNNLTWRLGANISRGGTITFPVEKRCPDGGVMTARLNYTDNCGKLVERPASATPSLILSGNIIIQKNPEVIFALEKNASWKIYVTNTGSGTAYNVTVNDTLDSDLSYVSSRIDGSADPANTTVVDANHVLWSLGDMPPKKQRVIEMDATLVGCENLNNRVQAVWGCGDEECQTPVTDSSVVLLVDGQLLISRHDAEPIDDCGDNSSFLIVVRNGAGPTLYNVSVKEALPAGIEYVPGSSQVAGGSTTSTNFSGGDLEWRFDQPEGWPPGKSVTITFDVNVTSDPCEFVGGEAVVQVNYTTPCGAAGASIKSEILVEETDPHVSITKTPELTRAGFGRIVTWTIYLYSNGGDPATNVTLFDLLPENTVYVSATPEPNDTDPLRWDFGTLNFGESRTVTLNANVTYQIAESENNATVFWGCCPDDMGMESDVAFLRSDPLITLSKDHGYIDTCGGNFTITINNNGSAAYTPRVEEVLPVGFVYKAGSAIIASDNESHTFVDEPAFDYSLVNGTVIWDESNIDLVQRIETITISFEVESCATCCNVSVTPNSNLVYFNYTNRFGDPRSKNFSQAIAPKLAVLEVEKTPLNQTIGGSAQWTIKVTNSGNSAAYNVTVIDILGDGFVGVAEGDGNKTADDPTSGYTTIRWTNLTIPVGGTWERGLTASGISSGSLLNNAYVFGTCENGCIYSQDDDAAYTARINITKDPDSVETIGGFANFTIRVEYWGEGENYNNTRIVDTLPAGLKYDSYQCVNDTKNEGCGTLDVTGNVVTWDLGNFTGSRIIEINLSTIVENVIANQNGTILVNRVRSLHEDENGTVFEDGDEAKVTVVEPDLSIEKTPDPSGIVVAGGEVRYTIRVTHTAASASDAFDLVINDSIPSGLAFVPGSNTSSLTTSFSQTGQNLSWTLSRLNLTGANSVLLTYNVTVDLDVLGNTTLLNFANVTWTSTSGANPNERTGNGTGPNDYFRNASAPVSVENSTTVIKLPDDLRFRTIGESVNYTIEVDLPNATVGDLWVNDTLPSGLIYNTTSLVVLDKFGSVLTPTETLSDPNDGTSTVFINWSFGTFNNSDDRDIVITFDAIVANVAANQDGRTIGNNSASYSWLDGSGVRHTGTDESGEVEIEEPDLDITKTFSPAGPFSVGDTIHYEINVTNSAPSRRTAFDLVITDEIPVGLSYVNSSDSGVYSGSNRTVTWTFASLALDSWLKVTYNVTVDLDVLGNTTLLNFANVTWTSTSGANPNERTGNGTGPNDYFRNASAPVSVENSTTVIKLPDDLRFRTIGESVNYTIEVDLPNATVGDLWVNDTLPSGLIYNTTSLVVLDKFGAVLTPAETLSDPNDGTSTVYINWSFGTFNNSEDRDIVITFDAIVANVAANQDGRTIGNNSAAYSWLDGSGVRHTGTDDSGKVGIVEPDLSITKSVEPFSVVKLGDEVRFTLVVNHTGLSTSDAYDLVIEDVLPLGLTYVSNTSTPEANSSAYHPGNRTIRWSYDRLEDPGEVVLTYNATVDARPEGLIFRNSAGVTWTSTVGENPYERNGSGTGPNDYIDSTSIDVIFAEITVDKVANVSSGSTSTRVNFTITVNNTGNATLNPVVVTDTLPVGLDDPVPSGDGSAFGNVVVWNLGQMDPGASRALWLTAHINGSAFGNLTNKVFVEGKPEEGGNVTGNGSANVTAVDASISIDKMANVTSGSTSTRVNFTLVVNNTGNATLDPVVVTDTLPFGLDDPLASGGGTATGNVVVWSLGPMDSGASRTLWVTAHINGSAYGNLTNLAFVEGKPEKGDNVTDDDFANVTAVDASISIDKMANVSSGSASTRVNFTLVVNNTGNATLDPVVVTDTLPFGLDDPVASDGGSTSGNVVVWNLGPMDSRASRTLWVTAHINGSRFGNLTNLAFVEGKPQNGDNVTDDDSANVTAVDASISIDKMANVSSGSTSTRVNFTLVVNNTGNATLDPVVVTDTLPFGLDDPIASDGGSAFGNVVVWNLGRMDRGDSRTLWVTAHINGSAYGNLTNVAIVEGKPEKGDNVTDDDFANVTAVDASISIDKMANVTSGSTSTRVNFTLIVNNTGNATLDPVVVTDTLPFGLDDPVASDGGSASGNVVVWNLGQMDSGDSRTLWLTAHINGSAYGNLTNVAIVEGKPEKGDNVTDDDFANVTAVDASISIDKMANVSSGSTSTRVNFTLVVNNTGNATLDPAVVTDTLPFGLDDPVASDGGSASGNVVVWNLGRMDRGDSRTLWLTAHINGSAYGNLTNVAIVEGKPEKGDNVTDDDFVNVTAIDASISIDKKANVSSGSASTRVNFTLVVNNTGNATLDPVVVTDTLPFGLDDPVASDGGTASGNVVVWNLGRMDRGDSRTPWLTAHINGSAYGNLTNVAFVEGKPENGDNVTAEDSANVTAVRAGISVHKVVDIPVGEVCTNVTFTIFVNNTGNVRLDPVVVADTLPLGLEYVSSAPPGARSGNTIIWNLGSMDPGEMRIVNLVAHINGSAFGELQNFVKVEGKPERGDNVTDNDTENVTALGAEIAVDKSVDIPVGSRSTRVNFTILVNNTGNVALDPVLVEDTLPFGLDDPVPSSGGIISGNVVTWNLGRLNVGENRTLWLSAHINGSAYGDLTNAVRVEGDSEFGENATAEDSENVTAVDASISIDKMANVTSGSTSTRVNFTLVVNNTGNATLDPVVVTDTLPFGLDEPETSSGGSITGGVATWGLGRMDPGDSRTLWLTAHINGSAFGTLTNFVEVVGKPEEGDNVTDEASANVTALKADIEVEKTVDSPVAKNGSVATFTIIVTNTGNATLDPVIVTDTLPFCFEYVSSTENGTAAGGVVTWNLGRLNSSDSRTILLEARVNCSEAGVLENLVEVEGKPEQGDNVTDRDTAELTIGRNLTITKVADKCEVQECDEVTYTITVCNHGGLPEENVTVWDVFYGDVEILSITPAPDPDRKWHFGTLQPGECVVIKIKIKVPERQDFEFGMEQGVSGEGFVKVANDYSTSFQAYFIKNCAFVTSDFYTKPLSACATIRVGEDLGTRLSTREYGSGLFDAEERVAVFTKNKSIEWEEDVSATYKPTNLTLYNNRTIAYDSAWVKKARAKNYVTGTTMTETYHDATWLDRESRMFLDKNESVMEVDSSFDGRGHVGFLKMPTNRSSPQTTPLIEVREDYVGSFKVVQKIDEYGKGVSYEKAASGGGLVVGDRRIGGSQRSYESGSGAYDSEEVIETYTNYIAKDISLVYAPTTTRLTDDVWINSSMKWKEGLYSRVPARSYIGEEYTGVTELDKETVARGLNEMETSADFSGQARYRAVFADPNDTKRPFVEFDEVYAGDYSIERRVLLTGTSKYDRPHLNVTKTLDGIVEEKDKCDGDNCSKTKYIATYTIRIENDGNAALGPIYVKDLFPPGAVFVESSLRPSDITDSYANWTPTHIAIGGVVEIVVKLDVTKYYPSELVNRVEVCGGYNGEVVCFGNTSALEVNWLTCCLNETVSVVKSCEVDGADGMVVLYRIDIENRADVTRVARVTDHLPEGMTFLDSSTPVASYDGVEVVWNLIDIGPFETRTIELSARASAPGRYTNVVIVDPRSVDGPVVQPVTASCVVEVGSLEECGPTSCEIWSPPNWDLQHIGYEPAEVASEGLACAGSDGRGSCPAP